MNVIANTQPRNRKSDSKRQQLQVLAPARLERRERDFGIGYGNSSGYVSNRRYAHNWGAARFQCV